MIIQTFDRLLHALTFRECACYCHVCACKEYAKMLAKKCKLKCPVCQREADRIVVKDAADDERVPALRRCKSAVIVREKLEEEILGMQRAVVTVQREASSQIFSKIRPRWKKTVALYAHMDAMSAIRSLRKGTFAVQRAKVQRQQEQPSQLVVQTRQNTQRSLTLRRYMKALSASKELVDAILDYCGAEVKLQQKPSSQTAAEGVQNMQTYSVIGLWEEAMYALEQMAEAVLRNCDAETPDRQESTCQKVAEGEQNTQSGDLTKGTYEKTKVAFDKLRGAVSACAAVGTPIQQTPPSGVRQVPLLHRCESATFTWDKQCPICQMTTDIDHESKCVSSRLTICIALHHCCRTHLCYCIENRKIVKKLKARETRVCPFPFCRKQVDRVIMNAAPWKPRTVEKEIKECLPCHVKKETSKAAEEKQKTKGSSSTPKEADCKTGDNRQKTKGSTSKMKEEASKSSEQTQKTQAPTTKEKGETSKAAGDRAQKTKPSTPKAKKEDSKPGNRSKKSKGASSKATDSEQEATIPTCSVVHGDT